MTMRAAVTTRSRQAHSDANPYAILGEPWVDAATVTGRNDQIDLAGLLTDRGALIDRFILSLILGPPRSRAPLRGPGRRRR
jgi:hypothetical protein